MKDFLPIFALIAVLIGLVGLLSVVVPLRFLGVKKRWQGAALLVASLIVLIVIGNNVDPPSSSRTVTVTTAAITPAPAARVTSAQPAATQIDIPGPQLMFIGVVEEARSAYIAAANDMAKGAARPARAKAICQTLKPGLISGWVGAITTLSSNSDGKGVLVVEIAPDIFLATWNNELSDIGHSTLIEGDSKLLKKTADMKVGQRVRVKGRFFPSETDCIEEQSVTLRGSMRKPEFTFKFADVEPLE